MADYPSDQDRLTAIEDILLGLLGGPQPVHLTDFDRLSYLQRISRSLKDPLDRFLLRDGGLSDNHPALRDKLIFWANGTLGLRAAVDQLSQQYEGLIADQFETLLLLSYNAAFSNQRFRRAATLSIYLKSYDSELTDRAEHSLREVASEIDHDIIYERPPEFGSWYKEIYVRAKTALTSKEHRMPYKRRSVGLN
jgi:hypothetical protein